MTIIDHFPSRQAAWNKAVELNLTSFSIQHCGEGWQKHKWVLIQLTEHTQ